MAEQDYDFNIADACPDGKANISKLEQAIRDSSIVTALDRIDVTGGELVQGVQVGGSMKIWFKDTLPTEDEATLNSLVANVDNEPSLGISMVQLANGEGTPAILDQDNRLVAAIEFAAGAEATKATHNFCDACTWFQQSVREEDVACTDSGDGKRFSTGKEDIIDMYHGRVLDETTWRDPQWCPQAPEHKYEVIVKVNGVTKAMQDPNTTLDDDGSTDGDYVVDYENGDIVFHTDQTGNTVTATFSRASTEAGASAWKLFPNPDYKLSIVFAEMQFSLDVGLEDTIFRRVGLPDTPSAGNFYDVAAPSRYMNMQQAIEESSRNSRYVPAIDNTSKRGSVDFQQLEFRYSRRNEISAATGVQIWVGLERDKKLTGTRLSVTFHFVVDVE